MQSKPEQGAKKITQVRTKVLKNRAKRYAVCIINAKLLLLCYRGLALCCWFGRPVARLARHAAHGCGAKKGRKEMKMKIKSVVVVTFLLCAKKFGEIAGILPAWYQTEDRPTGIRLAGFVLAQRVLYPLEIVLLRVAVRAARGFWWGPTVGPEAKELREIAIAAISR